MNRLTKNIRLVLISSSLALPGCGRGWDYEPTSRLRPSGGPNSNIPTACGPVDGRSSSGQSTGYRGYGGPVERDDSAVENCGGYVDGNGAYVNNSNSHIGRYGSHVGYGVPIGAYGVHTGSYGAGSPGRSSFTSVGGRSSSSGHSSIGGSVRGGFGSSAHGVSS